MGSFSWRPGVLAGLFFLAAGAAAAELRIGLSADVTTMDPHFVAAQPNLTAQQHVFDSLVRTDERSRPVPGIATWRTPDPLTWEFTLRKGVKFHDGSELTTGDVVFSLERPFTITGSPGGFQTYVRPIVAKEIVDRYTVRLKTAAPYGALLQDLAEVMIVSKQAAAKATGEDFDKGRAAVGTGPYRLVRFARGDRIELARHEKYWGGRLPWDRLTLLILPADPVRTAALLSGQIDAIEHVPTADIARLRKNTAFRLEQTVSWRTIFLHVDQGRDRPPGVLSKAGKPLDRNPFKDLRVRQAMSKAINRPAIAERVMEGLALPAANVVSPSVFGHDPAVKPDAYDPGGAKKLLAEAGYPDGFAVTLATPNNRYINDEQVAQTVAQMFSRIGIATKVEAMPLSVYFGRARNKDFGVALLGWGSRAADLSLRSLTAIPDAEKGYGAWNWGGYANPGLDEMVAQSLGTVDPVKREALARGASALAAREVAIIPLHYQVVTWAMRKGLTYSARTDEFTFAHHFKPQ
ncbi:MAG: ABC transporter substrate-binding protein [Betaproteobacteria bacterium RIFCSPLOWO2_02_FULL_67_26]|nr:MAG: ABC transporter substrate-binding protein [Betaproteobacteria bacterium RIFCSPLOWO2_02_FULL_67_26]